MTECISSTGIWGSVAAGAVAGVTASIVFALIIENFRLLLRASYLGVDENENHDWRKEYRSAGWRRRIVFRSAGLILVVPTILYFAVTMAGRVSFHLGSGCLAAWRGVFYALRNRKWS